MPPPIEPDKRAAIEQAVRDGGTCRGIATAHDVSPATVRKVVADAGITEAFDRSRTEAATRAKQADNRSRRAQIAAGLLDDVELARAKLRSAYTYVASGKDGIDTLDLLEPPAHEFKAYMSAAKTAMDAHIAVEKVDNVESVDEGRAAITEFMAAVRAGSWAASESAGASES